MSAAPGTAARTDTVPKVLIPCTPGFETTFDLAEALEQQLAQCLALKFLESGCVLVTPVDRPQHMLLAVKEVQGKPVEVRVASRVNTKGVVLACP